MPSQMRNRYCMRTRILICFIIICLSCSQRDKKTSTQTFDKTVNSDTTKSLDTLHLFASQILTDKIKASDNELTFRCLDSLLSKNQDTRNFYFKVFLKISSQADGSLAEAIGSYSKSYFQLFPFEYLAKTKNLSMTEKSRLTEYIAYEFYASGQDYVTDLDIFFTTISKKCPDCNKEQIGKIRQDITTLVKNVAD